MLLVYGVHFTNGAEEEMFQRLVCCLIISQNLRGLSVNSHGIRDLDDGAGDLSVKT